MMVDQSDRAKILEQAIQKAIDGGWQLTNDWKHADRHYLTSENEFYPYTIVAQKSDSTKEVAWFGSSEALIFNHDFAKALWGDKHYEDYRGNRAEYYNMQKIGDAVSTSPGLEIWQYHLQQMIIAEDLIAYLAENMP